MAKSGQEVLCEGWLTKSPPTPTKRIWRAKWRRRWFSLTQSGELPGQYILTYYADRNCRKVKGVIDLDHCEQVDLGLKLEKRKLKFDHVFDIKTPKRTYFLAADTETEMHSWVKNICRVCSLKLTDEQDFYLPTNSPSIEIIEEIPESNQETNINETPPMSPVSTSPYIPISECITGKSPILDQKDFDKLLEYNMKNSYMLADSQNAHINEFYEHPQRNYINYDIKDPRFYDCPRKLIPSPLKTKEEDLKNVSPLRSPTDSESVFTDDDWHNNSADLNNTLKTTRPSDSSADVDIIYKQKYTKSVNSDGGSSVVVVPPPRPPKPINANAAPCYLNLTTCSTSKETDDNESCKTNKNAQNVITDDMYDFPRSHVNPDSAKNYLVRRHCYNNAAPVNVEGVVFRYDISPKPGSSTTTTQMFRYDDESQEEPASPHSQTSSTAAYSNLPSPLLADGQLMPPPVVNRDLKPKRKLSSHSISSNPEPASPRGAPSVDRKLKPPTPLQEPSTRKHFSVEDDNNRKVRAAPSPTPPNLGRSHESLLNRYDNNEQFYHSLSGKMQYLDLDLEGSGSGTSFSTGNNGSKSQPTKTGDNVYKEIDFIKTVAFNVTRNNLEKERQNL